MRRLALLLGLLFTVGAAYGEQWILARLERLGFVMKAGVVYASPR